jgi:hypothetical protein
MIVVLQRIISKYIEEAHVVRRDAMEYPSKVLHMKLTIHIEFSKAAAKEQILRW